MTGHRLNTKTTVPMGSGLPAPTHRVRGKTPRTIERMLEAEMDRHPPIQGPAHGPPKDPYRTARKFHKAAKAQDAEHRRFWDDMGAHTASTESRLPRKVVRNCTTTATGGGLPRTSFTTTSVSTRKKNG